MSMTRSPYSAMKMTAIRFSRISTPFTHPYASPMKRNSITPSPSWTCWEKDSAQNFQHQSTGNLPSLASIYAGIPLAPQTENKFNWYFGSQSFYDLLKRQTGTRAWQNPLNPIGKWLPRTFNQLHSQTKTSTTKLEPGPHSEKCPVYLHIPWIGNVSTRFEKQITSAVKRCFFSIEPRVVFTTRQLLPATMKGVLPSNRQSNVIYQIVCYCDSRHVGRTSQRLEERIKQHIPKSITNSLTPHIRQSLTRPGKTTSPLKFHQSAIGQHLFDNAQCALHYNQDKFSILARARTPFHLSTLEATFIKSLNPLLSKQKEFVYSLKIS